MALAGRPAGPRPVCYLLDRYVELSQTFVRDEIGELRRQGLTLDVIAVEPGDVAPGPDEPVRYLQGFSRGSARTAAAHARLLFQHPWVYVGLWRRRRSLVAGGVSWRLVPVVAAALRREGVCGIHAHFAWGAARAASEVAAIVGVPWSVTLHARDFFTVPPATLAFLETADRVVTVCEYNREWIGRHLPNVAEPLVVVCGVVVPSEGRADDHDRDIDVLAVGRLVEKKGFDVLLAASAALIERWPAFRVEVVGDGPERARLGAAAVRLGVDGHVRFAGALDHGATLQRMERAAVFCLPARIAADGDRDSMPVVVKEAMVRRVPVVATTVGGIPEMVDDTCGRLVAPDDTDALAAALAELLQEPAMAAALGRAGRARVIERFTLAGEVAKLCAAFVELYDP